MNAIRKRKPRSKLIDMSSTPKPGTLHKRLLLIPESAGMLTVRHAINAVELVFTSPGHSLVVRSWEFNTRTEATRHYRSLPV